MRRFDFHRALRGMLLVVFASCFIAACGGRARPDTVAAPDVPSAYDLTVIADKDSQFDVNGATLSEEDVKGALRYRRDQNNAARSVLLKRGEKQKVTDRHISGLARIGFELKTQTFLQEKADGEITEVRAESAAK